MKCKMALIVLVLASGSSLLRAQDRTSKSTPPSSRTTEAEVPARSQQTRNGQGAKQQVADRFDRTAPRIGEPLPDLAAFDARGNPVRLSQLRGKYTVLTFGCLT